MILNWFVRNSDSFERHIPVLWAFLFLFAEKIWKIICGHFVSIPNADCVDINILDATKLIFTLIH